jgi:two-component system chemotaxis response regulator CheV
MEQRDGTGVSVGTILSQGHIIVMLDFESIIVAAKLCHNYMEDKEIMKTANKNLRMVIAEDSTAIREMIKCTLEDAGYKHIKAFPNGQEAKDYIFELKRTFGKEFDQHIDLLITDIEMPVLDGYTLTKSIKEDPVLNTLKVMLFSSLITPELLHKGKVVGADVQISKPSMKNLVDEIENLMSGD